MFSLNIDSVQEYRVYKDRIEGDLFKEQNLDMNVTHPIYGRIKPGGNIATLRFECLFQNASKLSFLTREKGELLNEFDSIINDIRNFKTDDEYMDSRCYPTGLAMKDNIMIVGEAPGTKGRAKEKDWLKPSFVFTRTSWILRIALQNAFGVCPYITNLLKCARPGNKVAQADFFMSFEIFKREVAAINPRGIIVLGKNPYDFLKKWFDTEIPIRYIPHPAYAWRNNWELSYYSHFFSVEAVNFHNAKLGVRI